jgi:WD40 repeat protein/serine/threonine protein kinase
MYTTQASGVDSASLSARLEGIAAQFEAAWQHGDGSRPAIAAFLPDGETVRRVILVELIHTDLEFRLKAGEAARVETYLEAYPDLLHDDPAVLELIRAEYHLRQRNDPGVTVAEYEQRFPQFQAVLSGWRPNSDSGAFAEADTPRDVSRQRITPGPGQWPAVPGHEILDVLGKGGMGIVFRARHLKLNRLVALKMIKAGGYSDDTERLRFQREAQLAARLQHPNIVQVFDVGEASVGGVTLPFVSLEYVEEGSLSARLNGTPMPVPQAAELVETLARTMSHAHQQGIIHRDLKPANVLLQSATTNNTNKYSEKAKLSSPSDSSASSDSCDSCDSWFGSLPKITDFGLAKQVETDGTAASQSGAIVGTPSYMAPEQAQGKAAGPAADIYALGAILYETLTGRPPFRAATMLDTLTQVIHDEPVPPSRLQPAVPRDLETICLKCLAKDVGQRYRSARELAEDLRRFRAGEPIQARPVSNWERLVKWARRRPAVAVLAAFSALVTLAALVVVTVLWLDAEAARQNESNKAEEARQAGAAAEAAQKEEERAKKQEQQRAQEAEAARREADRKSRDYRIALSTGNVVHALGEWSVNHLARAERLLERCPWDLRHWEYNYVKRLTEGARLTLRGFSTDVSGVAFCPDGKRLLVGTSNELRICAADSGKELFALARDARKAVFSPDGKRVATAPIGRAGLNQRYQIVVRDADTAKEELVIEAHLDWIQGLAYSRDGKYLASAAGGKDFQGRSKPGEAAVWDARTGKEIHRLRGHTDAVYSVAFSPDSKRLATAGADATTRVWDLDTGKEVLAFKGHAGRGTGEVTSVAFSPDGNRIASGGYREARVWDATTGKELLHLQGHTGWVVKVAYSPDGRLLATAGRDHTVKLWEAASGEEQYTLKGHTGLLTCLAFSPDGRTLASGGEDRQVKVWDVSGNPESKLLRGHQMSPHALAFSPDGKRLVSCAGDPFADLDRRMKPGEIKVWDVAGSALFDLGGPGPDVLGVAFSPDCKQFAYATRATQRQNTVTRQYEQDMPGQVIVVEADTGKVVFPLKGHPDDVRCVAFSSDGEYLVSGGGREFRPGGPPQPLLLWDARTGKLRRRFEGHRQGINAVAFSPDNQRLASGAGERFNGGKGELKVWDINTGKVLFDLEGHTSIVHSVAFCPNGKWLVSASGADAEVNRPGTWGEIFVWNAVTGEKVHQLPAPPKGSRGVAFSPDSTLLATGHHLWDGKVEGYEIKLWDPNTGQEIRTIKCHAHLIYALAFTSDNRQLVSASWDKTVSVWDATTGNQVRTLAGHTKLVNAVALSRDGLKLVTGSSDGTAKVWEIGTGRQLLSLPGHGGGIWTTAWSGDGALIASGGEDRTIIVWDVQSRLQRHVLTGHSGPVHSVSFTADGRLLASGSSGSHYDRATGVNTVWGELKVHDLATGKEVLRNRAHTLAVLGVAFSRNGKLLASASADRTVKLWDMATGQELRTMKGHNAGVSSVAFSADGRLLVSGSYDQTARLWDVATGEELHTFKGHGEGIRCVAFHPDSSRVASASWDQTVRLWDVVSGQETFLLRGEEIGGLRGVTHNGVAFSPDGNILAACSEGYTNSGSRHEIKLWDATTRPAVPVLHGHTGYVYAAVFRPDGKQAASTAADRTVKVWDLTTGEETLSLKGRTELFGVMLGQGPQGLPLITTNAVVYTPDGARLAFAGPDHTVKVVDARTGMELLSLGGHDGEVTSLAISPDGKYLVAGTGSYKETSLAIELRHTLQSGGVKVWDLATGKEVYTVLEPYPVVFAASVAAWPQPSYPGAGLFPTLLLRARRWFAQPAVSVSGVAFSPDGKQFASATGGYTGQKGVIRIRETATGRELFTLRGHKSEIYCLAWSPHGSRLASFSPATSEFVNGKSITTPAELKIWNPANGKELQSSQREQRDTINGLAWSPDGRFLAAAMQQNSVGKAVLFDADLREVARFQDWEHLRSVTSVAFRPDGQALLLGNGDYMQITRESEIRLWDVSHLGIAKAPPQR